MTLKETVKKNELFFVLFIDRIQLLLHKPYDKQEGRDNK
jgi:hypothetical protein